MWNFAKYRYVALGICLSLLLQGCDWVKGQMGMPTSKDIEVMKQELALQQQLKQQEAAREQRVQDSLKRVEEMMASVPKVEGYYVVLGSFKDHRNAQTLENLVKEFGHSAEQILLKNGFMMVAVGGHSTYSQAYRTMEKIGDQDFCPYDMWIYGASQNLHSEN